jgi:hypothetical protein
MGAEEALEMLDTLRSYDALTMRTARLYVMKPVYRHREFLEGSDAYRELQGRVSRYLRRLSVSRGSGGDLDPGDEPLSEEAADYLKEVLVAASGRRCDLAEKPYNGYSEEAYREVRSVLGDLGLRWLGISPESSQLLPDTERVLTMLQIDSMTARYEARKKEGGQGQPQESSRFSTGNTGLSADPPRLEAFEKWEPRWPELEPLPDLGALERAGHKPLGFGQTGDQDTGQGSNAGYYRHRR